MDDDVFIFYYSATHNCHIISIINPPRCRSLTLGWWRWGVIWPIADAATALCGGLGGMRVRVATEPFGMIFHLPIPHIRCRRRSSRPRHRRSCRPSHRRSSWPSHRRSSRPRLAVNLQALPRVNLRLDMDTAFSDCGRWYVCRRGQLPRMPEIPADRSIAGSVHPRLCLPSGYFVVN